MQGASRTAFEQATAAFDELAGPLDDAGLSRLFDELSSVVALLDGEPALRRSLSDPALDAEAKVGLARSLLESRVSGPTLEVVSAAAQGRWSRSRDLADALEELAAAAAFVLAERSESLDEVEDQLFRFGRILDAQPGLWSALSDPELPAERKRALVHALLEEKVAPVTLRLVEDVVTRPRGRMVDEALEELARMAAARQSRLIAEVRVAVPLTADERDTIAGRLTAMYGQGVHLQVEIDPGVVGGLLIRVRGEVIDATVATRLAEATRRITR